MSDGDWARPELDRDGAGPELDRDGAELCIVGQVVPNPVTINPY
jgi:hypothetical protein